MGVTSLWDRWTDQGTGEIVMSFTMLTVDADGHPVMGRFHRQGDEKRSVLVLEPEQFEAWLQGKMTQCSALVGRPAEDVLVTQAAADSAVGR